MPSSIRTGQGDLGGYRRQLAVRVRMQHAHERGLQQAARARARRLRRHCRCRCCRALRARRIARPSTLCARTIFGVWVIVDRSLALRSRACVHVFAYLTSEQAQNPPRLQHDLCPGHEHHKYRLAPRNCHAR